MTKPPCSIQDCVRPVNARGLCASHYKRAEANGTLANYELRRQSPVGPLPCTIEGCEKVQKLRRGMCNSHYMRYLVHGDPFAGGPSKAPKGSGCTDSQGYRWITVDKKQISEHRYVMSNILGRPLLTNESVHHVNGNKTDNRPENLELWVSSQPAGQRVPDLLSWADEIIARYRSEGPGSGGPGPSSPPKETPPTC